MKLKNICEMLLSIWAIILGSAFLLLIVVPTNLVGFYGAHLLRERLLRVFVFLKILIIFLVSFTIIDYASSWSNCENCGSLNGEIPIISIIAVLVVIFQLLCVHLANQVRTSLISAAQGATIDHVELNAVEVPQTQSSQANVQQHPLPYPFPQYTPYPMPYMQQTPQGYATMPYPPYPGYAPDGQQQQQHQQQQHQPQQHTMPAVYPTYLYPEPGQLLPPYETQQDAPPSHKDSDPLLQDDTKQ